MENKLTHFDHQGNAVMVDVSEKSITTRIATAQGKIQVNEAAFEAIVNGTNKKGDVLGVARIAGIMGVKKTSEIIPLCHPLLITSCNIEFQLDAESLTIQASCTIKVNGQTGVEMEALTGVNIALLTIYDMCKAIDKDMIISDIKLMEKQGGKSKHYIREEA